MLELFSQCRHHLMYFSQTALSCRCHVSDFVVLRDLAFYVCFNMPATKPTILEHLCSLVLTRKNGYPIINCSKEDMCHYYG